MCECLIKFIQQIFSGLQLIISLLMLAVGIYAVIIVQGLPTNIAAS